MAKENAPLSPWARVLSAYTHAHGIAENKSHNNPRKYPRTRHHASFTHQAPPVVHFAPASGLAAKNVGSFVMLLAVVLVQGEPFDMSAIGSGLVFLDASKRLTVSVPYHVAARLFCLGITRDYQNKRPQEARPETIFAKPQKDCENAPHA